MKQIKLLKKIHEHHVTRISTEIVSLRSQQEKNLDDIGHFQTKLEDEFLLYQDQNTSIAIDKYMMHINQQIEMLYKDNKTIDENIEILDGQMKHEKMEEKKHDKPIEIKEARLKVELDKKEEEQREEINRFQGMLSKVYK